MRPVRTGPVAIPDTRDRADHWTTRAACATPDGIEAHAYAITFPHKGTATAIAKTYCNGTPDRPACPFKAECLRDYDLLVPDGVIGGLDEDERATLRDGIYRKRFTPVERKRICAAYEAGDSTVTIAERMGSKPNTIQAVLRAEGVTMRTKSESAYLRGRKGAA